MGRVSGVLILEANSKLESDRGRGTQQGLRYSTVSPCQASAYLLSELKSQGAEAPREGGEMTQCLRALAILVEDSGLIPSIHIGWLTTTCLTPAPAPEDLVSSSSLHTHFQI